MSMKYKLFLLVGDKKLALGPLEGFSTLEEASRLAGFMTNYPNFELSPTMMSHHVSTHMDLKFHIEESPEEPLEPLVIEVDDVTPIGFTYQKGHHVITLETYTYVDPKLFSLQNRPCKVTFEELQ